MWYTSLLFDKLEIWKSVQYKRNKKQRYDINLVLFTRNYIDKSGWIIYCSSFANKYQN